MYKLKLILVSCLIISLLIPYSVRADHADSPRLTQYGISGTIAGYKTLTVFTSNDTLCMRPGSKRLVLQTSEDGIESYLLKSRAQEVLIALKQELSVTTSPAEAARDMPSWQIELVGPKTTLEEVISEHEQWNQDTALTGCQSLSPVLSGSDWTEIKTSTHPYPGYAIFEDLDAGTYTDDNAQGVYIVAPSTPNTNEKFHVLNNVRTNGSTFYLLQNGLYLVGSSHHVSWTDTTHGYVAQFYSMSYTSGHNYLARITYTSGVWQMCAQDTSIPSTYTCILESNAIGTTLVADLNTSVWLENQISSNPTWYQGWPSTVQAFNAKIYRNGVAQNWSSNHRHTNDSCSQNYPATNALQYSLVSGGNGYFILSGIPLDC